MQSRRASIAEILQSKRVDPELFLQNLGFAGPDLSLLSKLPSRFLSTAPKENELVKRFHVLHPEFKEREEVEALAVVAEVYGRLPPCYHSIESTESYTTLHRMVASHSPLAHQKLRRQMTTYTAPDNVTASTNLQKSKSLVQRRRSSKTHSLATIGEFESLSSVCSSVKSLSSRDVTDDSSDEELSPITLNCRVPRFPFYSQQEVLEDLVLASHEHPVSPTPSTDTEEERTTSSLKTQDDDGCGEGNNEVSSSASQTEPDVNQVDILRLKRVKLLVSQRTIREEDYSPVLSSQSSQDDSVDDQQEVVTEDISTCDSDPSRASPNVNGPIYNDLTTELCKRLVDLGGRPTTDVGSPDECPDRNIPDVTSCQNNNSHTRLTASRTQTTSAVSGYQHTTELRGKICQQCDRHRCNTTSQYSQTSNVMFEDTRKVIKQKIYHKHTLPDLIQDSLNQQGYCHSSDL